MSGELMQYSNGVAKPERRDRRVAAQAKRAHDEVRLRAFQADGVMALAGHIMEGLVALDNHRRALSKEDPMTNALLSEIESQAIFQAKKLQANLYNGWDV